MPDRTGTGTKSLFGASMRFSLEDGRFPLITTKKTAFHSILTELLFFIRGHTDNKKLTDRNVHIWSGNSSKEFYKRSNVKRKEGDLGPIYGFQWRHFGAEYKTCEDDYKDKGVDQLKRVVDTLKQRKVSRRLVVSAWNPLQLSEMALPPCHCLFQFYREGEKLSCALYQRSADMGLGVPFNIASYALLTIIVARLADLEPCSFVHFLGDYHVYLDHEKALREQIKRDPFEFPTLTLRDKSYRVLEDFEHADFALDAYKCHPKIELKLSI